MIEVICGYGCKHEFPDDWDFGPDGEDERSDPRWQPSTYTYLDNRLQEVHVTQRPRCDEEALDYFTNVASWGDFRPFLCQVKRPGADKQETLAWTYNKADDTLHLYKTGKSAHG